VTEEDDEREDDLENEVKPRDGLLRYWTFYNGEQYRLLAGLAAVIFGVLWCYLYFLGEGQSFIAIVLLVLAVISLAVCRLVDIQLRECEERGWKKDKRSRRVEKVEIRVAVALWLLIVVSIGVIMLLQWQHAH